MSADGAFPRRADVVILTALDLEYQAVRQVDAGACEGTQWEEEQGPQGLPVAFRVFKGRGGRPLRVLLARAADMGAVAATQVLLPWVQAARPQCVAMCGVCAGRRGKTNLGDVVAAERLFFHDTGKSHPDGFQQDLTTYLLREDWKVALERFDFSTRFQQEAWWRQRPIPFEWQENWVLARLREGVDEPWNHPDGQRFCPRWDQVIEALWASGEVERGTCTLTEQGRKRIGAVLIKYRGQLPDLSPTGALQSFKVHVAPMGSGSQVIEDESVWGFISLSMRKTLALEMEAAALGALAHAQRSLKIDALVLKGVMDFADAGRDDHFKPFAARASAECLLAFLREHLELKVVPGLDDLLLPGSERTLPAFPPPSALLSARHEVVPFHESRRRDVLEELRRWCEEGDKVAVRLLHADGGVGKTRLAIECSRRRRREGWIAGFLPKEVPEDWFERLCGCGQPVFVVIDYAESRSDLRSLLSRVHRYEQQEGVGVRNRMRLLLLARGAGDWWLSLRQSDEALGSWLEVTPPHELAPLAVTQTEREEVFHEAAARFAEKLGRPYTPRTLEVFSDERFTRVLYLHMAALASVERLPVAASTLLEIILDHEERFWETRARQGDIALSLHRSLARQMIAAATLRGGFSSLEQACLFAGRLLGRPVFQEEGELLSLLQRIYQDTGERAGWFIPALEPDLLGEGLVLRVAAPALQSDRPPPDWIQRVFPPDTTEQELRTGLEVLGRASASRPEVVRAWLMQLLEPLPQRALVALDVAKSIGKKTGLSLLGDALADALEKEGTTQLALGMWEKGIPQAVSLRRVREWMARTFLGAAKDVEGEDVLPVRAFLLGNLGSNLSERGRQDESLDFIRESIDIYRALAQTQPTRFLPELALSLRYLGEALRGLGDFDGALSAVANAVEILQAVSQHDESFKMNLAGCLVNMSAVLLEQGQHQDAASATRRAIEILRPLSRIRLEEVESELSMAFLNLSISLGRLNDSEGALGALQEAVALSREMALRNPDIHLHVHALHLMNLGHLLESIGNSAEAVLVAQEAVELYRPLVRRDPKAFGVYCAQALGNLSVSLHSLGRPEEAVSVLRESAERFRALVQLRPAVYEGSLARCLSALGVNLEELGRHEEAVLAYTEAIGIFRSLVQRGTEDLRALLSMRLSMLGKVLRRLNRNEEALAAMQEGLDVLWPVFMQDPPASAPDTAFLLTQVVELDDLLGVEPSFDLMNRFILFSRLIPLDGEEDPSEG